MDGKKDVINFGDYASGGSKTFLDRCIVLAKSTLSSTIKVVLSLLKFAVRLLPGFVEIIFFIAASFILSGASYSSRDDRWF